MKSEAMCVCVCVCISDLWDDWTKENMCRKFALINLPVFVRFFYLCCCTYIYFLDTSPFLVVDLPLMESFLPTRALTIVLNLVESYNV